MAKNGNSTNTPKYTEKSISKSTAKSSTAKEQVAKKQIAENETTQDAMVENFTTKYFSSSSEKSTSSFVTDDHSNSTAENSTNQSRTNKKFPIHSLYIRYPIDHLLDMAIALKEITYSDADADENLGVKILLGLISEQIYTSAVFLESLDLEIPGYKLEMREEVKL